MEKNIVVTCALPDFEEELRNRLKKSYTKKTSPVQREIELSKWTVEGTLHVTETNIEFAVSNYQPLAQPVKEGENETA